MKAFYVRAAAVLFVLFIAACPLSAQTKKEPPSQAVLAEISARGRALFEYDTAAWYSTDAVQALKPKEGSIERYVAKRMPSGGWVVAYGRLNEKRDKFLIAYEAVQGDSPQEFKVKSYEKPKEDAGFYLFGALALDTAVHDFRGERRPYNAAVLPAANGQLWVYVMPAQTEVNVYLLGGDVRYLISKDGQQIVEKRQLHKSIIEYRTEDEKGGQMEGGAHTAILDDLPEDTDVFLVLTRKPPVPEYVLTENFAYIIAVDGKIAAMSKEAFLKLGKEK